MQAAGHLVEVGVVGGQPGHLFLLGVEIVDGSEGIANDLGNAGKTAGDTALGDLEQAGFGGVEHHQRFFALVRRASDGRVADSDQLPGQRLVFYDPDVLFDARPARKPLSEGGEIGDTAHRFHLLAAGQLLREGHNINRAMGVDQLRHAAEDAPMRVQREIFPAELFRRLVIGVVVEQDRAQNRTLRLHAGGKAAVQRHIREGGHRGNSKLSLGHNHRTRTRGEAAKVPANLTMYVQMWKPGPTAKTGCDERYDWGKGPASVWEIEEKNCASLLSARRASGFWE